MEDALEYFGVSVALAMQEDKENDLRATLLTNKHGFRFSAVNGEEHGQSK